MHEEVVGRNENYRYSHAPRVSGLRSLSACVATMAGQSDELEAFIGSLLGRGMPMSVARYVLGALGSARTLERAVSEWLGFKTVQFYLTTT